MNWMIICGIVLGAAVIVTDRYIHPLSNIVAIITYTLAVVLVIIGMIISRN